jgi:hypothetical protein
VLSAHDARASAFGVQRRSGSAARDEQWRGTVVSFI